MHMDNRVYYGEYSLKHWIDLILKQNIILPEYQRHFVWDEGKVRTLIKTLKIKQFVPPVTIGAFKNGGTNKNLLLDGQQRLTSILLAYLGLYPNEKTYQEVAISFADENDDSDAIEEPENVLKWTFKALTQEGKNRQDILKKVTDTNYKKIEFNISDDFLKNTFLGFSYLVPDTSQEGKIQQKYYSSVFRNINIQGQTLLPQESRASLYFLDTNLDQFFDPSFVKDLVVKGFSGETQADFVRYLSLLSQYKKDGNSGKVARGYKSQMEKYYEEYIYSVAGENTFSMFADFSVTFPGMEYKARFERLKQTINSLEMPKQFSSIIDLDIYLFGLICIIVFEDKTIDVSKKGELKQELEDEIQEFKVDPRHAKSPSALKYLKSRIDTSVEIYKKYVSE